MYQSPGRDGRVTALPVSPTTARPTTRRWQATLWRPRSTSEHMVWWHTDNWCAASALIRGEVSEPESRGVRVLTRSWSLSLKETMTLGPICFIWSCSLILTFVQFILQQNLCLYTIVHLLFKEFKICLKLSLSTQSVCHTVSPRVRDRIWFWNWSRNPGFLVPESECGVLNFLTLKPEFHKTTRTLHFWCSDSNIQQSGFLTSCGVHTEPIVEIFSITVH